MESWRTHAASASERARLQARHAANAALLPAPAPHEGIDSSTAARPSAQILALFTHANRKGTTIPLADGDFPFPVQGKAPKLGEWLLLVRWSDGTFGILPLVLAAPKPVPGASLPP